MYGITEGEKEEANGKPTIGLEADLTRFPIARYCAGTVILLRYKRTFPHVHISRKALNHKIQITNAMAIEDIIIRFLAPLFGVLFGIPFAFWIDRKIREGSKRERAIAVLSALKEEINHNTGLLKQIQNQLKPNSMIYYNMDMNTWKATSLEEFEGIISHELLRHIYRIYYEYEHMSRKINTQFDMHYSVVRAMNTYLKERQKIVGAILKHAEPLEKESEQLIKEMETELTRLSKNQPMKGIQETKKKETKEQKED